MKTNKLSTLRANSERKAVVYSIPSSVLPYKNIHNPTSAAIDFQKIVKRPACLNSITFSFLEIIAKSNNNRTAKKILKSNQIYIESNMLFTNKIVQAKNQMNIIIILFFPMCRVNFYSIYDVFSTL